MKSQKIFFLSLKLISLIIVTSRFLERRAGNVWEPSNKLVFSPPQRCSYFHDFLLVLHTNHIVSGQIL